jgi:predicted dehydrogenase
MGKPRIGIIGIGKISGIYLANLTGMFGRRVTISAVCDLIAERAERAAELPDCPGGSAGTCFESVRFRYGFSLIISILMPSF